jgi:hypothetical protein
VGATVRGCVRRIAVCFAVLWGSPLFRQGRDLFGITLLGAEDLANIVDTYWQNEARFKRDYKGKRFEAILPFFSAKAKESLFEDQYVVGFGGAAPLISCVVSDKSQPLLEQSSHC